MELLAARRRNRFCCVTERWSGEEAQDHQTTCIPTQKSCDSPVGTMSLTSSLFCCGFRLWRLEKVIRSFSISWNVIERPWEPPGEDLHAKNGYACFMGPFALVECAAETLREAVAWLSELLHLAPWGSQLTLQNPPAGHEVHRHSVGVRWAGG